MGLRHREAERIISYERWARIIAWLNFRILPVCDASAAKDFFKKLMSACARGRESTMGATSSNVIILWLNWNHFMVEEIHFMVELTLTV